MRSGNYFDRTPAGGRCRPALLAFGGKNDFGQEKLTSASSIIVRRA